MRLGTLPIRRGSIAWICLGWRAGGLLPRIHQPIALELAEHSGPVDPQHAGYGVHVSSILLAEFAPALRLTGVAFGKWQNSL